MATYGVRIKRNGKIVDNADEAQSVLINVFGGGNVHGYMASVGRWEVTVPRRIENRIERLGYHNALTGQVGSDAIEWR